MSEEPSLPCLPAVSWDEQSQSFSNKPRKRLRRQRGRAASPLICDSSDPAIFSSDDDPGLDNYVEGRRKKRYVGSWFQQRPTSPDSGVEEPLPAHPLTRAANLQSEPGDTSKTAPKRTFTRQPDSGIYLGSDITDSDDVLDLPDVPPSLSRFSQLGKRPVPKISQAELVAQKRIQDCLEQGNETLDLWSLGLEDLSNDTISPLSQFSCIPVVTRDVAFEQKEPELRIFLANNFLTRLPGALLNLTHLTVLSLRGNELTEIPPAICKLSNLKQLNLAQNRLRTLPAEFLDLLEPRGKLRELALHPNPLVQPRDRLVFMGEQGSIIPRDAAPSVSLNYRLSLKETEVPPIITRYLARSPLQVSNSMGVILSDFSLSSAESPQTGTLEVSQEKDADDESHARRASPRQGAVPSLLEAALRTCYLSGHVQDLEAYLPNGASNLQKLLRRTAEQHHIGGLTCSRCRKLIVVPVVEWVEWEELRVTHVKTQSDGWTLTIESFSRDSGEMAVPFLHRACSWGCAPQGKEERLEWRMPDMFG